MGSSGIFEEVLYHKPLRIPLIQDFKMPQKPLREAHWRQVWRNYLFQRGLPLVPPDMYSPKVGPPSWFPQSPGTVGYGPHPWRQVLFQGGFSQYHPNCTPPGGSPSWAPTPSRPSLPPTFYPQPICYFLNVVSLGQL